MNKTTSNDEALFYAEKSIQLSLTRDMLLNYIKADDYSISKDVIKSHNFEVALPENIAAQADEMLKSKYNLGFIGVSDKIHELNFEKKLVEKIRSFILELGVGFSFIGNQYRLEYNNKEYAIDMLFFNRNLRSLVAIELKMGEFIPEYAGKMNMYLNLLDRLVKTADENPSIGIILCASKDNVDVEIALQGISKPIGVAEYQLQLPQKELKEMIQRELENFDFNE
ncbi:MAG: PDDEXK nuclease domain-containing protein [Rikenellaceae bacterium]